MRNAFLTLLSIFVFAVSASAQQVEALGKVERDTVAVGKPFTLDLEMKVPYGYYVEWNPFATDTLSGQIGIVKGGEIIPKIISVNLGASPCTSTPTIRCT